MIRRRRFFVCQPPARQRISHCVAKNEDEVIRTRATLLDRLKNWNDQASWQEFFDIYWQLIYGVARKAGLTDAEAQDVVQETLVAVAKHMPKHSNTIPPSARSRRGC
jgi:hypothetical protein